MISQASPMRDQIVGEIYSRSEQIAKKVTKGHNDKKFDRDDRIDHILTSRIFGYPIMLIMLGVVIWVTIAGANVPSGLLGEFFGWAELQLSFILSWLGTPLWLHDLLTVGLFRGVGWVIAVMLPPMAIFFPIFAILEDYGYLPRVAFNMDRFFKRVGAHGKQSLTMAMGFGCNAAGIIACRIIESPRERLIAILTNNFVPCNGRWPTLIVMAAIFMGGAVGSAYSTIVAAAMVVVLVLIGISVTLAVAWGLSKTALKGIPSNFTLELPPYRRPQFGRTILRSMMDKTWFVLRRAVIVAAPAGVITWLLGNIQLGELSILAHIANFLQPIGYAMGLDGYILMAFILGLPANEIVLPILIMGYMASGGMMEFDSLNSFRDLLVNHGWTWLTALNMMLFSLLHYPCGTTIYTIAKETKSKKWTLLAVLIPTSIAVGVTFLVAQIVRFFGWV
nr:nucleoside recognition domain-containing protein [Ammoniphilus resinae]